ncbi:hypothetical protein N665_1545s0011 [Sinapis alba]|nr:hypothetical protein N665_1545s0011 [Sinapis alba]
MLLITSSQHWNLLPWHFCSCGCALPARLVGPECFVRTWRLSLDPCLYRLCCSRFRFVSWQLVFVFWNKARLSCGCV